MIARRRHYGAALLEVILALTLLVAAGTIIGGSVSKALRAAGGLRRQAEAADLAVSLASEVQMGLVEAVSQGPTAYDPPLDGWTWEVVAEPLEVAVDAEAEPTLQRIDVIVRHEAPLLTVRLSQWMAIPPAEPLDEAVEEDPDDAGYADDATDDAATGAMP